MIEIESDVMQNLADENRMLKNVLAQIMLMASGIDPNIACKAIMKLCHRLTEEPEAN